MFEIPALVLKILTSKWLWIGAACIFLMTTGASCEHKRMAKKLDAVQLEFDSYKSTAVANVNRIRAENTAAIAEAEANSTELHRKYEVLSSALSKEIDQNEELKRIHLSKRTVRVFNDSTRPAGQQEPNPGTTAAPKEDSGEAESATTLANLFKVATDNNVKANECVDQYIELYNLYEKVRKSFD